MQNIIAYISKETKIDFIFVSQAIDLVGRMKFCSNERLQSFDKFLKLKKGSVRKIILIGNALQVFEHEIMLEAEPIAVRPIKKASAIKSSTLLIQEETLKEDIPNNTSEIDIESTESDTPNKISEAQVDSSPTASEEMSSIETKAEKETIENSNRFTLASSEIHFEKGLSLSIDLKMNITLLPP